MVRPCAEGPSAPGPTPATLVRPVAATTLPAGGPHAAGRTPPFLAAAAAGGAVSHPALARIDDAAVKDRPYGQAHLAHVIRLGDVSAGRRRSARRAMRRRRRPRAARRLRRWWGNRANVRFVLRTSQPLGVTAHIASLSNVRRLHARRDKDKAVDKLEPSVPEVSRRTSSTITPCARHVRRRPDSARRRLRASADGAGAGC